MAPGVRDLLDESDMEAYSAQEEAFTVSDSRELVRASPLIRLGIEHALTRVCLSDALYRSHYLLTLQ